MSKSNSVGFYVTCAINITALNGDILKKYGKFYVDVENYDNLSSSDKFKELSRGINLCVREKTGYTTVKDLQWAPVNIFRL